MQWGCDLLVVSDEISLKWRFVRIYEPPHTFMTLSLPEGMNFVSTVVVPEKNGPIPDAIIWGGGPARCGSSPFPPTG